MRIIKIIIFFILLLSPQFTKSQYYSSGADPANIKWMQVKSPFFKVVYPEEFDGEAKRFIAILDSLYLYGGYSLKHTPKPIKVLVHSRSAYSNGFVSWAPKRMEIYPTPHQDMFAQDWLEQLAIHEFRHVVQIDMLNRGFTRFLTIPFGQQAVGAVVGLYAPLWFLEGDAVVTETTLSEAGRGREPSFEQEIRSQVLEKQIYNYDKAYFGSYKDYVPNYYNMGYLMVAGARYKYGVDVWEKALDYAGRKSWSLTPFNKGIKKVTGKNKVPLYNEVYNEWKQKWKAQDKKLNLSPFKSITNRDTRYKNYLYPTVTDDEYIIVEINGPGEVNHFAKINIASGDEEKILITGSREREPFSYNNNTIVWTELEQHPRWDNQYFSVIRTYDLKSGKQKKLTHNSRYKAPALSPDGKIIAAVHTSYSNEFSIHLLSAEDGSLTKEIKTPDNSYPMTPSWNDEGDKMVMVLLTPKGKKISTLKPESGQWNDVTTPDFTQIRYPKFIDEHIYFNGSWSGIENIYRINKDGFILEKVTESKFGAAYVSRGITNNSLLYQHYTSDGYIIAYTNTNELNIQPFSTKSLPTEPLINKMQKEEKGLPDFKDISTDSYKSKRYSKWNLFNFHSWAPFYVNMDDAYTSSGISALSQNLLGTTIISAGYNADKQNSQEKYNFKLSYQAWWPVFEMEVKMGDEKIIYDPYYNDGTNEYLNFIPTDTDSFAIFADTKVKHMNADVEMKLPLNLTRGKFFRKIQPSVGFAYQHSDSYNYTRSYFHSNNGNIDFYRDEIVTIEGADIRSMDYSFFAYNLLRSSQRDIATRCGQVIELSYSHSPFGGTDYGSILGIGTRLYFPGIGRHHAISINNRFHTKNNGDLYNNQSGINFYHTYNNYARFPRGVDNINVDKLYSFKGDYMMPVLNPDFNIRGIMYLKRISMNLFYDYSKATQKIQFSDTGEWKNYKEDFHSIGAEIRGELHPFRFVFPIVMGYRYAYLPDSKKHYHEMLLSTGLSSFVVGK